MTVGDLDISSGALESGRPLGRGRAAQIRSALLAGILDHRLTPGTRLPEDEIGAIFGASRTIVRTALQSLAHERVVVIEPNRGAQVAYPTVAEARQVFEARSLLEPRLAALAAERATPTDVERLRAHHAEEEVAISHGNQRLAVALSARFHNMIADVADQAILAAFVRELMSRSSLVVALYWHRSDATCEKHAHHALLDAIAEHKADKAADLMLSHIVDLYSGLDLRERPTKDGKLSDLLGT